MVLFHYMVQLDSVRHGTARFAFPLQFSTTLEWAGLFTCRYSRAASTAVTPEKRFNSTSLHQSLTGELLGYQQDVLPQQTKKQPFLSCLKKGAHSKQLRSILRWLCWFKSSGSVVSRVARSMTQTVTIFSGQSVISRVYTSRFGNGTASLEPRRYKKKVPGTVTLWKTPQMWTVLNHTMQWKSAITVPCPACVREVVWW